MRFPLVSSNARVFIRNRTYKCGVQHGFEPVIGKWREEITRKVCCCCYFEIKFYLTFCSSKTGWSKIASMKGHITVWGKSSVPQNRNSIAIRKLVCRSNTPNFWCTPNVIFDSRVIFKFSVCLFATQNRNFLLAKRCTRHQQIKNHFLFLGFGYKVNVRFNFRSRQTQVGMQVSSGVLFRVPLSIALYLRKHYTNMGSTPSVQTDRQTDILYSTSGKVRYQGKENDRKVFESSSPTKYKSNCTEDDQKSTKLISAYIYLQRRCRHIHRT